MCGSGSSKQRMFRQCTAQQSALHSEPAVTLPILYFAVPPLLIAVCVQMKAKYQASMEQKRLLQMALADMASRLMQADNKVLYMISSESTTM